MAILGLKLIAKSIFSYENNIPIIDSPVSYTNISVLKQYDMNKLLVTNNITVLLYVGIILNERFVHKILFSYALTIVKY